MTDPCTIIPTRNMSAEDARAWLEHRIETGCVSETDGYAIEAVLRELSIQEQALELAWFNDDDAAPLEAWMLDIKTEAARRLSEAPRTQEGGEK